MKSDMGWMVLTGALLVAIGSASFGRWVRDRAEGPISELEPVRDVRRRATVGEVRSLVEALLGQPWAEFAFRHGDWGKPLFLWAART